jgi:type IV pilus assembly protein PilY1
MTLLVGGLGKGGKGYYALDVTDADTIEAGDSSGEDQAKQFVLWEYPKVGTTDDDLGYTYSKALIVKSNAKNAYPNGDLKYEWVVIFGNGYDSTNCNAVLYIMDIDGNVIKKIDTAVGTCNGLSTPALVDVNADFKVDYAYAGDLEGNLWKFDLTDPDINNWTVAFKDGTTPKPLFQVPGQPITTKPDVMVHLQKDGYMVIFGTGRYLSAADRTNTDTQTIYGIWDYGDDDDDSEYLGSFNEATGALSNQPTNVTLLEQTEIDYRYVSGHNLRTLSDHTPNWDTVADSDAGEYPNPADSGECSDSADNDGDGDTDENDECSHVGWYFDLPLSGERVIKNVMIRDKKAIVISSIPNSSPCAGGGDSLVHEMNATTGARLSTAQFDINGDNVIDGYDLINIGTVSDPDWVVPTGKSFIGILHPPVILRMPDDKTEQKIFSSSSGVTESLFETAERRGLSYWREVLK